MSEMWLGSIISVDCGDVLGEFVGQISNVDKNNQTISLINASRNNKKCEVREVTLGTQDIRNLKLIESTVTNSISEDSTNCEDKLVVKNERLDSPVIEDNQKKKGTEPKNRKQRRSKSRNRIMKEREEECFNVPVESIDKEFDFEKNLALFDKRAVFDEINALSKMDHVKLVDCNKRGQTNYRFDENVLASDVPVLKQINVPCNCSKEYVTDAGLVIPSVSVEFKKRLYQKGEEAGLVPKARMEMIGRGACEMVLHLVGGSHRLHPQNNHQRPTVIILCGPHIQGAQAVNCGRHLSNHCVNVILLSPPKARDPQSVLLPELKMFDMSSGKIINSISDLPSFVDIIVDALESHDSKAASDSSLLNARQWSQQSKAPVLCLDPPPDCSARDLNFILSPALPFSFENDKCSIHICDIGLPDGIFRSVGCTYSSPFGSKFVIPLYSRSEALPNS